jgi:hypothetical protein
MRDAWCLLYFCYVIFEWFIVGSGDYGFMGEGFFPFLVDYRAVSVMPLFLVCSSNDRCMGDQDVSPEKSLSVCEMWDL